MNRPFFVSPLLLLLFIIASCATRRHAEPLSTADHLKTANNTVIDGKLWSSLQQRAAEYQALCLQAYNIARLRIEQHQPVTGSKPAAIITDIDETFLDNSRYAVHQALSGKDYDINSWMDWTSKGIADTLTGALDFFNFAASKKVEIFYITNREEKERTGTLSNLQRFKFPYADNEHLVMRNGGSSKERRRQQVAANHDILLLLGDNLADFSTLFDKKKEAERMNAVATLRESFGNKFIVLPNFNYGGWEEALYHNSFNWTAAQKDSIIRGSLKGY